MTASNGSSGSAAGVKRAEQDSVAHPAHASDVALEPSREEAAGEYSILDCLPDAAVVFRNGDILHVNRQGGSLLGPDTPDALTGARIADFLIQNPPGLTPGQAATDIIAQPLGLTTVLRSNGTMLQVELFLAATQWAGEPAQMLILRDVSEQQEAVRELQVYIDGLETNLESSTTHFNEITRQLHDAKEAADSASRTKSEFLANMSHELRTPLNAIMGFSEVIKNEMFGHIAVPQYVEYARDIYSSGSHLLDIINDILDLSKVEAGKFNLSEENVAIEEVVFAVCNIIKGKADEKNLHIAPRLPGIMPRLFADKRALKQMMLNLLSNAVKFTPTDGDVSISAMVEDNGGVAIVISDSGIGIAPEDMQKVLAPFGQVESDLGREHEGTGLGVPLVKAMIELHGGTLSFESTLGVGSVVTLRFPPERSIRSEAA